MLHVLTDPVVTARQHELSEGIVFSCVRILFVCGFVGFFFFVVCPTITFERLYVFDSNFQEKFISSLRRASSYMEYVGQPVWRPSWKS